MNKEIIILLQVCGAGFVVGSMLASLGCSDAGHLSMQPGKPIEMIPPGPTEPAEVTEARALYPRTLEVHSGVIARTCSPNPGVCHQANNYPDMRTAGSFLALALAPCNLELPDPKQGWDSCEKGGDRLRAASMDTEIAWIRQKGSGTWRVGLKDAATSSGRAPVEIFSDDGSQSMLVPPAEWDVGINLVIGEKEADLTAGYPDAYLTAFVDSVLATVRGGDPNENGVYGASDPGIVHGALITPGDLEQSYLWRRITGTVAGSRMPLANEPLSQAEYVALACFIEGLAGRTAPSVLDAIDYDHCTFAKNPVQYAH